MRQTLDAQRRSLHGADKAPGSRRAGGRANRASLSPQIEAALTAPEVQELPPEDPIAQAARLWVDVADRRSERVLALLSYALRGANRSASPILESAVLRLLALLLTDRSFARDRVPPHYANIGWVGLFHYMTERPPSRTSLILGSA